MDGLPQLTCTNTGVSAHKKYCRLFFQYLVCTNTTFTCMPRNKTSRDIRLRNMSGLDLYLSRSLKVKCDSAIGILIYGFHTNVLLRRTCLICITHLFKARKQCVKVGGHTSNWLSVPKVLHWGQFSDLYCLMVFRMTYL